MISTNEGWVRQTIKKLNCKNLHNINPRIEITYLLSCSDQVLKYLTSTPHLLCRLFSISTVARDKHDAQIYSKRWSYHAQLCRRSRDRQSWPRRWWTLERWTRQTEPVSLRRGHADYIPDMISVTKVECRFSKMMPLRMKPKPLIQ